MRNSNTLIVWSHISKTTELLTLSLSLWSSYRQVSELHIPLAQTLSSPLCHTGAPEFLSVSP